MIPSQALDLIKEFEGCQLHAYKCPAGVWTIGYGLTRLNGRPVRSDDRLSSEAEAEKLLKDQLQQDFIPKLKVIPHWGEMTEYQQAALISFAWNLGAHFYGSQGFETITKVLGRRQWDLVPSALKLYNKSGGKTLDGLVRRRHAEADLWDRGLNIIENEGKPMTTIHYFLDFAMGLDTDGRLEDGRLVLRYISEKGGCTREIWIATSSVANKQQAEDFHQKGGPIPPEYRVPGLDAWEVETSPIAMPATKGVEGNFYKIIPYLIKTDEGGERGDFGIHRDANVPGSAGCIVMSGDRFKSFEAEMKRLRGLGYMKLPLFITYPTN